MLVSWEFLKIFSAFKFLIEFSFLVPFLIADLLKFAEMPDFLIVIEIACKSERSCHSTSFGRISTKNFQRNPEINEVMRRQTTEKRQFNLI